MLDMGRRKNNCLYHFVFEFTTSLELNFDPSFEAATIEDSWIAAPVVLLKDA